MRGVTFGFALILSLVYPGTGDAHQRLSQQDGGATFAGATMTAAQRSEIHEIGNTWKAHTAVLHARLDALRAQESDLLLTPGVVQAARIDALAQQEAVLLADIQTERVHNEIALRNLLSGTQLAQAASTVVIYGGKRRSNRLSP